MVISSSFNRWYWKNIVGDIKNNLSHPIIWNGYQVALHRLSAKSIHNLMKMLTSYPKDKEGRPKSLTEVTAKELTHHLEEIRQILGDNGFTFYVDEQEWARTMLMIRS